MVDDLRRPVTVPQLLAPLALVPIQLQDVLTCILPLRPSVKQIFPAAGNQCFKLPEPSCRDQSASPPLCPSWTRCRPVSSSGLSPPENTKAGTDVFPQYGKDHRHRLTTEHWPWSIFTINSALQWRHQRINRSAWVFSLDFWFVSCLQLGQTYRPFLVISIPRF